MVSASRASGLGTHLIGNYHQHRQPLTLSLRKTTDMSSCSTKLAFRRCVMGASAQAMRLWSPSHPPRSSLSTRVTRHS